MATALAKQEANLKNEIFTDEFISYMNASLQVVERT